MKVTRPTVMEIDLKAFEYNIQKIKEFVGKEITLMPVVKANGYGTYINKVKEIMNKFSIVAVAIVDEAVELRNLGYENDILILNQPAKQEIEKIEKYSITVGVCEKEFLKELSKSTSNVKIHIEIDTGMGRTGIKPQDIENFIKEIRLFYNNIEIEGIYTHLSSPDVDFEYTKTQLNLFDNAIKIAKKEIPNIRYIHSLASNGILNFKDSNYNLIRPGIIVYGYKSEEDTYKKISLKPIATLKSQVTFLKEVEQGTSIGYSRTFITDKKMKIATIPIGYADGLNRQLSNKGYVVIKDKKAPIIGNVCMDSIMVDVTDIEDVKVGTTVYIWDNKLITLEEIASLTNTINYEVLSCISNRVPRIYK